MPEVTLTFADDYNLDGSIDMTLTVTGGAMEIPGVVFSGEGKVADLLPFSFSAQSPERRGDFGEPATEEPGWIVEPVSAAYEAGVAEFRAIPIEVGE